MKDVRVCNANVTHATVIATATSDANASLVVFTNWRNGERDVEVVHEEAPKVDNCFGTATSSDELGFDCAASRSTLFTRFVENGASIEPAYVSSGTAGAVLLLGEVVAVDHGDEWTIHVIGARAVNEGEMLCVFKIAKHVFAKFPDFERRTGLVSCNVVCSLANVGPSPAGEMSK